MSDKPAENPAMCTECGSRHGEPHHRSCPEYKTPDEPAEQELLPCPNCDHPVECRGLSAEPGTEFVSEVTCVSCRLSASPKIWNSLSCAVQERDEARITCDRLQVDLDDMSTIALTMQTKHDELRALLVSQHDKLRDFEVNRFDHGKWTAYCEAAEALARKARELAGEQSDGVK